MSNVDPSWLTQNSTDSESIASYYDSWSADYNESLAQWNYQSPQVAAELATRYTQHESRVLDAGCGTGLTGVALKGQGFSDVVGIDISPKSLEQSAATNAYAQLLQINMQQFPFPFEDDAFDAISCVGVLTYLPDTPATFREFCRIVRPGGYIIFTQRDDLYADRGYADVCGQLQNMGLWEEIFISEPMLYLPNNDDYADKILVIYSVYRVQG